MAKLKKAAVLLSAVIMACSAAGCSDTSYTVKADDKEIRAGIYIDYMLNEITAQINTLYYSEGVTDDFFSHDIDGKSFSEYVSEQAMKNTKEYAAVTAKFDELGLKLSSDQLKDINSQVNDAWDSMGEMYEKEGISKESLKEVYLCSEKRHEIFEYYYGEGGEEAVSEDDMKNYVNDNYLRYKAIVINRSTAEDEATQKTEDEKNLALRDEYLAKAEGVSFDEFDKIIDEYNAYVEEQSSDNSDVTDDDSSKAEDDSSSDESSEAADDSSEASDSSAADDTSSEDDSSIDESSDVDSSEADSSESSDDSAVDEDPDAESEEEEDPYPNEVMVNFSLYKDEDAENNYVKLLTEINGLELGKAVAYENESAYYIIIRGDVSERTDYAAENEDTVLHEMKDEEYEAKITEWIEAIKFVNNDKAIKRYTPETVYKKQNEYYESTRG